MNKHYHFIGIGGGMGGVHSSLKKGYQVSRLDLRENQMVQNLREQGARVTIGHARKYQRRGFVVFSSAVALDNPELQEAREKKIPRHAAGPAFSRPDAGADRDHRRRRPRQDDHHFDDLQHAHQGGAAPTTAIGGMVTSGSSVIRRAWVRENISSRKRMKATDRS